MIDNPNLPDADRAAAAIASLRNDYLIAQQSPILARLSADMAHIFDPAPPTQAQVAEGFAFKYGASP